jgi:hypothetical protein
MNPKIPDLLSRAVEMASKSLDRAIGDPRRLDQIDRLVDEVIEACDWPTDEKRRFVNDWTRMLMQMVRRLERLGPLGDPDEIIRAGTVAGILLRHVGEDLLAARKVELAGGREPAHWRG